MIKTILKKLGKRNAPETLCETSFAFNLLYDTAQFATGMEHTDNVLRRQRHYTLNGLVWNCDISLGDVCEVGCWRGLSAYQVASRIEYDNNNTDFHIFDSFMGLSELDDIDRYEFERRNPNVIKKQFACSEAAVKENLKKFPFIKYYKGWIPDRFNEVKDRTFSFIHIDVDLYQPTLDTLQFFYPRMAPGGIMVFDDYGCLGFPGAKKAIDKFLKGRNDFFLPMPSGQAFLIKGAP